MELTIPKLGHSQAADGPYDEDIDDACDQYEEEQEDESPAPDFDREIEPLDDIYRDLLHDFPMVDTPLPASGSDSFGDFVAKEAAKAKADTVPPPKREAAAGVESPRPDPAEMVAEAVRAAAAREKIADGVKVAKAEKKRRMKAEIAAKRDTKGHSIKESFKGAFGSAAILTSTTLQPIDKLVLQLVDSFATGKEKKSGRLTGPCTASNDSIAMYLGEEANYINKRLSVLQRQGLIITLGLKGLYTRRVVSPELSKDRAITEAMIAKYTKFAKR